MFKSVREQMKGLVSEASPDYEKTADPHIVQAIERSKRTGSLSSDEAVRKLGAEPEIRAKYKIEVMFDQKRTINGPNLCGIQLWESGKKFHGGGDELMYWCKDTKSNEGCGAALGSDHMHPHMPIAVCPRCNKALDLTRASNMRVVRIPTKTLSNELAKLFRSLGSNADIYVKYHKTDIHYIAMEKQKGPLVARKLKGMHIYPLKNLLRDTASGSDVADKIYAFLTA